MAGANLIFVSPLRDKRSETRITMKKLVGFIMFWIGIGLLIGIFVTSKLVTFCLISTFLIVGYNLFCCN